MICPKCDSSYLVFEPVTVYCGECNTLLAKFGLEPVMGRAISLADCPTNYFLSPDSEGGLFIYRKYSVHNSTTAFVVRLYKLVDNDLIPVRPQLVEMVATKIVLSCTIKES